LVSAMIRAPRRFAAHGGYIGPVAQLHQGVERGLDDVMGLAVPRLLVSTFCTPHEVITARTAPPAITPCLREPA